MSRTYLGYSASSTTTTSISISGANMSTAADDRWIVVGIATQKAAASPPTVSAVTVGGISCTKVAEVTDGGSGDARVTLWITNTPLTSGTTATIAATTSSTDGYGLSAWAIYGLDSSTPFDTATGTEGQRPTIDYPQSGVIIAMAADSSAYFYTYSWTGATEDIEQAFGSDDCAFTGASAQGLSAAAGQSIYATKFFDERAVAAATWGP